MSDLPVGPRLELIEATEVGISLLKKGLLCNYNSLPYSAFEFVREGPNQTEGTSLTDQTSLLWSECRASIFHASFIHSFIFIRWSFPMMGSTWDCLRYMLLYLSWGLQSVLECWEQTFYAEEIRNEWMNWWKEMPQQPATAVDGLQACNFAHLDISYISND